MNTLVRVLAVFLAVALLALALGYAALRFVGTPYGVPAAEPVIISIPQGATAREVAQILADKGVVARATPFTWLMRWSGAAGAIKAGEYAFRPPLTPLQVLGMLQRGETNLASFTLPEGLTLAQTVDVVAATGLAGADDLRRAFADPGPIRDLDPAAANLEGYLFPETYRFAKGVSAASIAKTLTDTFRARFATPHAAQIAASGRPLRTIVTLASLVEKETAAAEERPLIAGVYAARLARRMPLQCDPTIIYARQLAGTWDGNIRRADLTWAHPYNTYVVHGLPPGPIASAGAAALLAALEPQPTKALYFVAKGDGTHQFSATLAEHNRAVERYQRAARRAHR